MITVLPGLLLSEKNAMKSELTSRFLIAKIHIWAKSKTNIVRYSFKLRPVVSMSFTNSKKNGDISMVLLLDKTYYTKLYKYSLSLGRF